MLGHNGSFNAFRILEQRVQAFEDFLTTSADELLRRPEDDELLPPGEEARWAPGTTRREAMREVVAAKVMGRWRNGVPLELSPTSPNPDVPLGDDALNDFDYDQDTTEVNFNYVIKQFNARVMMFFKDTSFDAVRTDFMQFGVGLQIQM